MQRQRCHRCSQSHSGPQAFLLTCRDCNRTWHHRCHIPPIEDGELIQRIAATNAKDTENDLSAWRCRRCSAKRPAHPAPPPAVVTPAIAPPPIISPPDIQTSTDNDAMDVDTPYTPSTAEPSSHPESAPSLTPDVDAEAQDQHDDDDLYGPPIERRVVRIYPSLAEELRENSRHEAGEHSTVKMKQHPSLAPQWILERHTGDPQWANRRGPGSRRRRAKVHSKRIGVHERDDRILLNYFTVGQWVKQHKKP